MFQKVSFTNINDKINKVQITMSNPSTPTKKVYVSILQSPLLTLALPVLSS